MIGINSKEESKGKHAAAVTAWWRWWWWYIEILREKDKHEETEIDIDRQVDRYIHTSSHISQKFNDKNCLYFTQLFFNIIIFVSALNSIMNTTHIDQTLLSEIFKSKFNL